MSQGIRSRLGAIERIEVHDGRLELGGEFYSLDQIRWAIACCHSVARAYEIADVANGGDGSVDWSDIDDAQAEAATALGPQVMGEIIADARVYNDFEETEDPDKV